jgi:hypothetical protein
MVILIVYDLVEVVIVGKIKLTDFFASSAESVGNWRLGEVAKRMVERDLQAPIAAEAVGSFRDQFQLSVETLDGAGRDLLARPEPVQDELAVWVDSSFVSSPRFAEKSVAGQAAWA